MTREAFIKKWLGNRDYNYCEEHKDIMRDDLDSVLEFHKGQANSAASVGVVGAFGEGFRIDFVPNNYIGKGNAKLLIHPDDIPSK